MKRSLDHGSVRYEFIGANDSVLKFNDLPAAMSFLRAFKDNPTQMAALRDLVADHSFDVHRIEPEEMLARLGGLLVSGRVKILRSYQSGRSAAAQELASEKKSAPAAKASTGVAPAKKHWVEFRLVDDTTGDPIQGVELTIKLPDGSIEKRTTDAGGYVEINDTLKGNCEISVDVNEENPSALYEFVRIG
jgi:hypothetical protein